MRSKMLGLILCLLGLWMISEIAGLFSSNGVMIELVDVSPVDEAQEERFLLYVLEHNFDNILFFSHQAPEQAVSVIRETKASAQSVLAHLQQHPVGISGISQAFEKVVELADGYETMIGEVGVILAAAKGTDGQQVVSTMVNGATLGYGAVQMLDTGDGGDLVVGALTGLLGVWYENQTIEANRKAQIGRVTNSYYTKVDQAREEAVATADAVAQKHSWDRESLGFARDRTPYGQERLVRAEKDLASVLAELAAQAPLNPILQFKSIMLEDFLDGDGTTQQKHLEWSTEFVQLARLVPAGAVYDYYRWRYLMRAGTMALKAAEQEGHGGKLGDSLKAGVTAASCWKTALNINRSDSGGELRWGYGHSLALAGDLDMAHQVLSEIKDHFASNPDYHYLLARLLSVKGEPGTAMENLKTAVAKGLDKIAEARETKDLENLRKAYGDEVSYLLAVRFDWSVTYGIINDDITITNKSSFPLTHLVLSPVISNTKGSFNPRQKLTLEKLDAGKSHTWVNCISVSGGGTNDSRKAELQCDQDPL